jgi:SSS family solute:Na+ symporter
MSTASGALIAAATVARTDVVPFVAGWFGRDTGERATSDHDVRSSRWWVLGLGIVTIALAVIVQDVVAALTIAYDILVGGLLVAILGGLVWRRGNGIGAGASMAAGTLVTLGVMAYLEITAENQYDGIYANEPIYYGLAVSALVYVAASLATRPTAPDVMAAWDRRVAGQVPDDVPVEAGH